MMESATPPVFLSYTQHLPKAYISRSGKFVIAGALLIISLITMQTFMRNGNLLGPLIAICMFAGFVWIVIARLRSYILTVHINGVGIGVRFSDGVGGPAQLFGWDEIGSIVVRPIDIRREFGWPGPHLDYRGNLFKGSRFRGRKFSYICDGTEAIELRTRDGRIAIITVSDGNAVRAALEAAGHPTS